MNSDVAFSRELLEPGLIAPKLPGNINKRVDQMLSHVVLLTKAKIQKTDPEQEDE